MTRKITATEHQRNPLIVTREVQDAIPFPFYCYGKVEAGDVTNGEDYYYVISNNSYIHIKSRFFETYTDDAQENTQTVENIVITIGNTGLTTTVLEAAKTYNKDAQTEYRSFFDSAWKRAIQQPKRHVV